MNEQKSLALGAPLTPETFSNFVERLRHDCDGDGVKDHGTADAIFTVQAKRRITGLDREHTDNWLIHFDGCEWTNPLDYWNELEKETQEALDADVREKHDCSFLELHLHDQFEFLGDLRDHTLTGYQEVWEHVNSHFTRDAAEAFIKRKKHDYRRGLRVYVEAQTYCWEWNAIKQALIDGRLVLKDQHDELLSAAKAVIERWNSPLWKDLPPTADVIARLRDAVKKTLESLAATTLMPSPPMSTVISNLDAIAAAVAAEREACAKVLDEMADEAEADMEQSALVTYYREKAAAIRARGNA